MASNTVMTARSENIQWIVQEFPSIHKVPIESETFKEWLELIMGHASIGKKTAMDYILIARGRLRALESAKNAQDDEMSAL